MKVEKIMEACVHLMGARSSPAVANMCLLHHACQVKDLFDMKVFIAMMVCFYVDDYLDSVKCVREGRLMKEQLTEALKMGGFPLLKWKSNFAELNNPIIPKQVAINQDDQDDLARDEMTTEQAEEIDEEQRDGNEYPSERRRTTEGTTQRSI